MLGIAGGIWCGPLNFNKTGLAEFFEKEKYVITFQDEACANLAMERGTEMFGADHKFLKNIGMMIVDADPATISSTFATSADLSSCV